MDISLNGIISYKIKIKSLNDNNNLQTKSFIESLNGHDETILKFLKNVKGTDILFPTDPLFCFITESGDYLLVTDMHDNILDIFVLWISSKSPHTIIKCSTKELYIKLKSNKKNGKFKFVNNKFDLFTELKVDLYPTYMSNNYNEINIENKYNFLKIKKEKQEILHNKSFIARLIFLLIIIVLILFTFIFNINENFLYLLLGALIPEMINIAISLTNNYNNENIFLDISTLRISEKPSDFHNPDFDDENLDQVTDPE